MSSIIQGYNYDIFISYRQKDNKGDMWVSAFVEDLKTELESTFKDEISVYFDISPHDGLLETHDVDESLKEKLKCLVFIPVISRTYCDPKSFAWEHEFRAFLKQVSNDRYGPKIKIPGGNVANRVLPVQIHDLDAEDRKLVEGELGGHLRGIEFIYKEPGVDRPLTMKDNEGKNLNKTSYRNQINKVALAIREIINALRQYNPPQEEKSQFVAGPMPTSRKINKPTIFTISVITLALIILGVLFIPKLTGPTEQLEKSIAVLPFNNESPVDSNKYFINGIMEEVLNNLQGIKELRVASRTSTEQYRGVSGVSTPEIAKQLGVNYIVEGSGQKYGNSFRLRVQLIVVKNGKEGHLWGKPFEKELTGATDLFKIQSQIAQAIASELKAVITPEEKQLIEKVPTRNLTALDYYQQGQEELNKYDQDNPSTKIYLDKANALYKKALVYDSTFAQAYIGLAHVYWNKNYSSELFSSSFMDSAMMLVNRALTYDSQLSEAYVLKGRYYYETGEPEQAIQQVDKALKFNPNDWEAYLNKGTLYMIFAEEMDKAILNLYKAYSIYRGPQLPVILNSISSSYRWAGFMDQAILFNRKMVELNGDSATYFYNLGKIEEYLGNYKKAGYNLERAYLFDSTQINTLQDLMEVFSIMNQKKKSLKYANECVKIINASGSIQINYAHRIGYIYWINGNKKESEIYLNEQKHYCYESIRLKLQGVATKYVYYDLAAVQAFMGEKDQAIENLMIFNQRTRMPLWVVTLIKNDPLFDSIRDVPEFQQIVRDVETKYRAEHERLRKWLNEQGML